MGTLLSLVPRAAVPDFALLPGQLTCSSLQNTTARALRDLAHTLQSVPPIHGRANVELVWAMTSGFEGAWTANPIKWDNDYFKYLLNYEWESHIGPGGHYQWRVKGGNGPTAPVAYPPGSTERQDVMMLTTDIALVMDPEYKKYVVEFANDEQAFRDAFAAVWYKLVNRDMG
jgi:catalase (peroxidase I)